MAIDARLAKEIGLIEVGDYRTQGTAAIHLGNVGLPGLQDLALHLILWLLTLRAGAVELLRELGANHAQVRNIRQLLNLREELLPLIDGVIDHHGRQPGHGHAVHGIGELDCLVHRYLALLPRRIPDHRGPCHDEHKPDPDEQADPDP